MINVLKRLAELDAKNPNVIKESTEVAECGPMGMMDGMSTAPSTPASLSVTAGSGEELGSMLAALMQLAGVHKVEPEHLGAEPPVATMTAEPTMGADAERDSMRSVLDKMHDMGDEAETDESADEYGIPGVDTTPNDPTKPPAVDTNQYAYRPNSGSAHGRATKNNPHGDPSKHEEEKKADMTMEQQLMAQYKQFISESTLNESSYEDVLRRFPQQVQDFKDGGELDYDLESALWDYHFNNGDIINYDADASEYIGQNLADYLGVDENASEAYNPNSVDAEHRRSLEKSHEDDLKKRAGTGDESAKKHLQALHDKKERMRNDRRAAMER